MLKFGLGGFYGVTVGQQCALAGIDEGGGNKSRARFFQWFPMVANHWSNDGMVTIHRHGPGSVHLQASVEVAEKSLEPDSF